MNLNPENKKRVIIFLAFAFGIAWLTALVIFLTGGIVNSPVLDPNTGITPLSFWPVLYVGPSLGKSHRLLTRKHRDFFSNRT